MVFRRIGGSCTVRHELSAYYTSSSYQSAAGAQRILCIELGSAISLMSLQSVRSCPMVISNRYESKLCNLRLKLQLRSRSHSAPNFACALVQSCRDRAYDRCLNFSFPPQDRSGGCIAANTGKLSSRDCWISSTSSRPHQCSVHSSYSFPSNRCSNLSPQSVVCSSFMSNSINSFVKLLDPRTIQWHLLKETST